MFEAVGVHAAVFMGPYLPRGVALGDLMGLRLSRSNLQRYGQTGREGKAMIENRRRQRLLSWLSGMVTDDARTTPLYRNTRSWMAVPLKVQTNVSGVLRVSHQEPDYFDEDRTRLLSAVADQTALALSHANALALQRDAAAVYERNRIARELHDAVSQKLFAANLLAGALARSSGADEAVREQAQVLERLNRSALAEMRMMLFELRPDALASVRMPELLQQAVEALVGRGGVEVTIDIDDAAPLPTAQRIEIYRIAQAALSNIARHSGASHAHLQWSTPTDGPAVLRVKDDGCGFVAEAEHPGHFGVTNIRERASSLGANLVIQSAPGEGTEIILTLNRNEKTP